MGYFEQGAVATGTPAWTWDQYHAAARTKAEATAGDFLIILVGFDGAYVKAMSYPTKAAAGTTYDAKYAQNVTKPEDVAFAALYDKTQPAGWDRMVEASVNERIATVVRRKIDWRTQLPWVIGGAVVIAAAVFFTRSRKKTRAPARKRSKPSWRRRIVTTWR